MSDSALIVPAGGWQPRLRRLWRLGRQGLLGSPLNIAITLGCLLLLGRVVPPLFRWLVLDATWQGTAETCSRNGGACWAFIGEKLRFILFGFYPPEYHWLAAIAVALVLALVVLSALPRFWRRAMVPVWVIGLALAVLVMSGGGRIGTDKWGGLPLTVLLAVIGFVAAFPLALALALGRRSNMALVRIAAVTVIEVTRGVPIIALLYVAILLLPLLLPADVTLDKLLRAQLAIIGFLAAYQAEIIRAGLQAVPPGQYEAARSLGLGYWPVMRLVVLPQALRTVIPAFVTLAIGIFLDTTLVIVIGCFDLLNTARSSATDPEWLGFYDEAYGFVAMVFFVFCFIASRYSLWLERRLNRGQAE